MRRLSEQRDPTALHGLYSSLRSQQKELFTQQEPPPALPPHVHEAKISVRTFIMLLISNIALGSLSIFLPLSYLSIQSTDEQSLFEQHWAFAICPGFFLLISGLTCCCVTRIRHHRYVYFCSLVLLLVQTVVLCSLQINMEDMISSHFLLAQLVLLSILSPGILASGWQLLWKTGQIQNRKLVSLFAASRALPSLRILALLWECSLLLGPSLILTTQEFTSSLKLTILIGTLVALVVATLLCICILRSRSQSSIFIQSQEERQERHHSQLQQQSLLNHQTTPASNQFDILPFLEQQHGVRQVSHLTAPTPSHSPGTESQGSQGEQSDPPSIEEDIKMTAQRKRQYFQCDSGLSLLVCALLGLSISARPQDFGDQFSILYIWIIILIFTALSLLCYKAFVSRFWLESVLLLATSIMFMWRALGGNSLKPASFVLVMIPLLIFYLPLYGGAQRPLKKYFQLVLWTLIPIVSFFFTMPLPFKNWIGCGASLAACILLLCQRRLLPQ